MNLIKIKKILILMILIKLGKEKIEETKKMMKLKQHHEAKIIYIQ
jgi:hypothetical protein